MLWQFMQKLGCVINYKLDFHIKCESMILSLYLFMLVATMVQAKEIHVAVAANFAKPMERLKQTFTHATGHHIIVSMGSTGQLYAQIINGAPFEIFLAADTTHPQQLIKEQVAEGFTIYAIGQLVLWSKDPTLVDIEGQVLRTDKFKQLAIANPKMAPYGLAARQVLEKLTLWETLQPKIVQGNNVGQTYQFIAIGNAELGFIARAQYQATAKTDQGSHWFVPTSLHTPIQQGAVLLKPGENNSAAKAFMQFLKTPSTRKIIETFGYETEHL